MADVIKEYAIQISIQGNKAVIKEFKQIDSQVQKGTKNIDKQNKSLNKTNSLLWTYAKRLIGIYAIYKMINKGVGLAVNFAEQGNALRNLSTIANTSTKSLQKWGYVLKRFGGNERSVASTIGSLNQKLYERQYGIEPFQEYVKRYGALPAGTNAEDFLLNVARKMENYSNMQTKLDIADKLGLDEAMTNFLLQGSKAVESQLKGAGTLFSDEDIKNATKAKEQLIAFNRQLKRLANITGSIVLQPLTNVIKELTEFLKDPKRYIAGVFSEQRNGKASEYAVAKDMLNPMSMLNWYGKRMIGLTDYSATTGLTGISDWWSGMFQKHSIGDIKVTNNVNMTITGSNADEIADKVGTKANEITTESIKQSTGAR